MKNSILFLGLLALTLNTKNISAQAVCEFEKSLGLPASVGYKIIQTRDDMFVTGCISGYSEDPQVISDRQSVRISKLDKCGNTIWSIAPDSILPAGYYANIGGLIEASNEDILISISYGGLQALKGIQIIKTDSSGKVKWKHKITDSTYYYFLNSFEEINSNCYLIGGNFDNSDNKHYSFFMLTDTLGNIIFQKNIIRLYNGRYSSSVYKQKGNDILMLILEDSLVKVTSYDSTGGIKNSVNFYKHKTFGLTSMELNSDHSEIIFNGLITPGQLYVARHQLNGQLIKDTNLTAALFSNSKCTNLDKNINLISTDKNWIIVDSFFNIHSIDSFTQSGLYFYNYCKTKDNYIAAIGGVGKSFGIGKLYRDAFVRKRGVIKYAKSISINGAETISQLHGSIQLLTIILPIDAANKTVVWSVNDTAKGSISLTGLLTAKANGVVIVTATTTDGTNLHATKSISITNQGLGITQTTAQEEVFEVYPNPATKEINLLFNSPQLRCFFYDYLGNEITNLKIEIGNNKYTLNTEELKNGFYFLKITNQTDKSYYKRILIMH
ncbi:MAG: Ig-like domain-containing protein [Bacteroidia bacterium]|nr:Ig-like domain-containing protein [Bacteroidia bacterium]